MLYAFGLQRIYNLASFQKRDGKWLAQVARRGLRKSKSFGTKTEAKDWAAREEYLILHGEGEYGPGTIGDLFDRYAREVSPSKRGGRWEIVRLELFKRDKLAAVSAREARAGDFADWRDRRLRQVSPGSVRREMALMSAVMSIARKEWAAFPVSPMMDVSKPGPTKPRDRLVSEDEIELLVETAKPGIEERSVLAFRFAVETAMRAGEILSLTELDGSVARLAMTKNGFARDVPLSSVAVAMFPEGGFNLTSRQLDTSFRRVRDRAKIKGLTFHDSRATALTRMSRKVDAMTLARISGHRDLKMLLNVYYRETAEDIAKRLG